MSLTCFVCVLWANRGGYVSLAVVFTDARAARVHTDHLPSARVHFLLRCCWRCRWRRTRCHIAWRKGYVGDVSIGRRFGDKWGMKREKKQLWDEQKESKIESFFQNLDTNLKLQFVVQFRQLLSDGAASLHVCAHTLTSCVFGQQRYGEILLSLLLQTAPSLQLLLLGRFGHCLQLMLLQ